MAEVEQKKKQTFSKLTYCVVDLDQLLDMPYAQLTHLYSTHQRRKQCWLLKQLRRPMEKPEVVKTHLRDKQYGGCLQWQDLHQVEIKPEMINHSLGKFSIP